MMQLEPYEGFTNLEDIIVTPQMVVAELGPVIFKNAPHFPEATRETTIGRWINVERQLALYFVAWDPDDTDTNTPMDIVLIEEAVLYRACARSLRHAQVNRRQDVSGFAPSYTYLIEEYERMAQTLLHDVMSKRKRYCVSLCRLRELYPKAFNQNIQRMQSSSCTAEEECEEDDS